MPTRSPGERPKEGETVQEHDLEDRRERRDRQASEQDQKPKPKHETWLDWMPEGAPLPDLLSHDELIENLRVVLGIEITSSGLQYYRQRGILPRPIRRRHNGVTQPVYPYWFLNAIADLKRLQGKGKSLEEIKPRLRHWALSGIRWQDPFAGSLAEIDAALHNHVKKLREYGDRSRINTIRVTFLDDDGKEFRALRHETGPGDSRNE